MRLYLHKDAEKTAMVINVTYWTKSLNLHKKKSELFSDFSITVVEVTEPIATITEHLKASEVWYDKVLPFYVT